MTHPTLHTVTKVQQAKQSENQAACQAPVARSVYQAVLTRGRPIQLGPRRLIQKRLQLIN